MFNRRTLCLILTFNGRLPWTLDYLYKIYIPALVGTGKGTYEMSCGLLSLHPISIEITVNATAALEDDLHVAVSDKD